ncbi:MAG: hypothetical protein AAF849_22175 [Bacteroidota bacterium]
MIKKLLAITRLLLLCLLITMNYSYCQGQSLVIKIDSLISSIRNNNVIQFNESYVSNYDNDLLLSILEPYSEDKNILVQSACQILNYQISQNNLESLSIQREVVRRLINDFYEDEALLWQSALRMLLSFETKHFDPLISVKIRQMLDITHKLEKNTVLIIGLANISSEKENLKKIIKNSPLEKENQYWYNSVTWGAYLALARIGDEKYINYCLNKIKTNSDPYILANKLFNDLSYIRDYRSVNLLKEYVYSNEGIKSHYDAVGVSYAASALISLARCVDNLPSTINTKYPRNKDIEKARAWLKTQKTLQIKR